MVNLMLKLAMEIKAMKWISSLSLILLLAAMLFSCGRPKREVKVMSPTKMPQTVSKDLLQMYDKQIRSYYMDLMKVSDGGILSLPNKAQVEYTDVAVELLNAALRKRGFCPVDDESARIAILKYFNIDVTQSNSALSKLQFRKFIFKDDNHAERMQQAKSMRCDFFEQPNYFWKCLIYIPKYNYLMSVPPVIEDAVRIEGVTDEGSDELYKAKVRYGKLVLNLVDDNYFYENEFIFHDSKIAFQWLKKHDAEFLTNLLYNYGYDKNEDINRLVMNEMLSKYKEEKQVYMFENTFACKKNTKHSSVEIREGLLKTILNQPVNNAHYCVWGNLLQAYLSQFVLMNEDEQPEWVSAFTKQERFQIVAYISYYLYQLGAKSGQDWTSVLGHELYNEGAFRSYLEKNNYLNLPDYRKLCKRVYHEYDTEAEASSDIGDE